MRSAVATDYGTEDGVGRGNTTTTAASRRAHTVPPLFGFWYRPFFFLARAWHDRGRAHTCLGLYGGLGPMTRPEFQGRGVEPKGSRYALLEVD